MIHINERYGIIADEKQFILVEKVTRRRKTDGEKDGVAWKAGDEYADISHLTYHMAASDALVSLYRRKQRELVQGSDMTLQEAIDAFKELQNEIRNYLAEVEAL